MKNIFLAPRPQGKTANIFEMTVKDGYKKNLLLPYLTDEDKKTLSEHEILHIWGNRSGSKGAWNNMQIGDYVFFYQNGKITYIGNLLYKTHNQSLSKYLWQIDKNTNEYWEYIFICDHLKKVDIDFSIMNRLAGYSENNVVQGFQSYNPKGIEAINVQYGSIEIFIHKYEINDGNCKTNNIDSILNSIDTKSFIILSGISGTGKTQIARIISAGIISKNK